MGLIGLLREGSGGLWGILSGLTKSTDHPSRHPLAPKASHIKASRLKDLK